MYPAPCLPYSRHRYSHQTWKSLRGQLGLISGCRGVQVSGWRALCLHPTPFPVVPLKMTQDDYQAFLSWQSFMHQARGEEDIRRNETDVPLQPPPVQRVRDEPAPRQDPGKTKKGGGLRQLTIEETAFGSKGSRVLEQDTSSTHRVLTERAPSAHRSKGPRVLDQAMVSVHRAPTERAPTEQELTEQAPTERAVTEQTITEQALTKRGLTKRALTERALTKCSTFQRTQSPGTGHSDRTLSDHRLIIE